MRYYFFYLIYINYL